MSEKIKISVVIESKKSSAAQNSENAETLLLMQDSSSTLMSVLLQNHLMNGSFCGGRGDCGRCVVQFLEGVPLPTGIERARLTPEELRQGYRLACVTRPGRDCRVRIVNGEEAETPIVTEVNLPSEGTDPNGQGKNLFENQKSTAIKLEDDQDSRFENDKLKSGRYIIAADLGTTTIAMQLRDMATGKVTDTFCERNPQRIYGTDVLARIEASCNGGREELQRLVCGSLARGLRQFRAYLRREMSEESDGRKNVLPVGNEAEKEPRIFCMCIAGNTTMAHLLMGYNVASLGRAPFVPVETGMLRIPASRLFFDVQESGGDFPVYIAPCISAFVGGDIVAGLYALGMLPGLSKGKRMESSLTATASDMEQREKGQGEQREKGQGEQREKGQGEQREKGQEEQREKGQGEQREKEQEEKGRTERNRTTLLIDLGTNGEMAMTDGRRMIVTATAAGPAFEGRGDLIGTDRIALTADLLRRGLLDETGLLSEPYFEKGIPVEMAEKVGIEKGQDRENGKKRLINKNTCYFKQEDIRALQMAKAAVRAGVEILWEEMGSPQIDSIYLAGGFGYYLDVEAAFAIGLLPARMRGRVQAVGNTSLAGAYELGRDLSEGRIKEGMVENKLIVIESINLAEKESFEKLYLKYMNLEEN